MRRISNFRAKQEKLSKNKDLALSSRRLMFEM